MGTGRGTNFHCNSCRLCPSTMEKMQSPFSIIGQQAVIQLTLIPAFFVGCTSPSAVYFRTQELAKIFIKLQQDLRSYFGAQLVDLSDGPTKLFVGFIGAIQSGDRWFRAKVVDVENYPETGVFLVAIALLLYVNAKDWFDYRRRHYERRTCIVGIGFFDFLKHYYSPGFFVVAHVLIHLLFALRKKYMKMLMNRALKKLK